MAGRALIVWGGWQGHQPQEVAAFFGEMLSKEGFSVDIQTTLDAFRDLERLLELDLMVPCWTMGKISTEQVTPVVEAVAAGVGLAGCHGGMCDAFRDNPAWQFMTGGNWVSHPGGAEVSYRVNVRRNSSPLVEGLPDFDMLSEQYYLHVDPANEVLATTRFPQATWYHSANGEVDVPVAWTRRWGHGRVYYNSLGHQAENLMQEVPAEMMRRGFLGAAEGRRIAREQGLSRDTFGTNLKNF